GRGALRRIPVPVRNRGPDPSGGDGRRDRADAPRTASGRTGSPEYRQAEPPPPARGDRDEAPRRGQGGRAVIGIEHYVVVSAILFVLGVLGIFLNRKNVIVILMAIELILLAVNINLVAFSAFLGDMTGQVFAMFVLT